MSIRHNPMFPKKLTVEEFVDRFEFDGELRLMVYDFASDPLKATRHILPNPRSIKAENLFTSVEIWKTRYLPEELATLRIGSIHDLGYGCIELNVHS